MKIKTVGLIRNILFACVCISFVVGLVLSIEADKERKHNPDNILVTIEDSRASLSDNKFFVYVDYEITNRTDVELKYVDLKTYIEDENGRLLGTLTTTFGSTYSVSNSLSLGSKKSMVKTSYVSESVYWLDEGDMLYEIYKNGLDSYNLRCEITAAAWSDDYKWSSTK